MAAVKAKEATTMGGAGAPTSVASLEQAMKNFRAVQKQIGENDENRERLYVQKHENEVVLHELDLITNKDQAEIYRLVGPTLLPESYEEARSNVSKRLEWIDGEIKRIDDELQNDLVKKLDVHRSRIIQLQGGSGGL